MKKIFLIMFILSSFVFADKILTTSVGKLNQTSKVIGGYEEPHGVKVTWNLTKGRITTNGNSLDSAEEFGIRIWDKNNQRIDAYATEIFVNKALSGDAYKVYGNDLNDAKSLDLVFFNKKFNPTKSTFVCYNDNNVPFELENGSVVCANPDTTFKNKAILIYDDENDNNNYLIREVITCKNKEKCEGIKSYNINTSEFECHTNYYKQTSEEKCIPKKKCNKNEKLDEYNNVCVIPDSGYVWLNKDKNDLSQRPACKAENERYNENTNQCEYKIENSHWVGKSLEYECNDDYVLINGLCEEIASCKEDERYNEENNSCVSKPENSHWNQDNDIIWTCDNGYVERYGSCEVKKVCNEKQKYVESDNLCENPPYNGSWDYKGDVVCDEGYVKVGLLCEQKADCEHWNSEDNTCFEKPIHSHWVYSEGATWECDNGYHSDTENSYCFKCEGETQFNYSTNTCVTKPENSHWSGEGIWHCNEGFFETEYSCEKIKECGFFERYNSYTNECVNKPSDSHWMDDNSTNWECDDGYYKTYSDKCEKSNPIDLTNYISFAHDLSFGFGAGFGKEQQDNSTPIVNVEAYYNIGAKIGSNEFFKIRTQFSIGLLYTGFEYSSDYNYIDDVETVNSIAFTFGPNIGFDFWKFSFDYSYVLRYGESLESVTFNNAYSKYKFGFNINEHFNVNVSMISNMISSTSVLNEFDDYMFSLGLTYRF